MIALAGTAGLAIFTAIVLRPQFGAYLYLFLSPLIVGVARGDLIPILRPNEILVLTIIAALAVRLLLVMLSRRPYRSPMNAMDFAFLCLAVTSSIIPVFWRMARGFPLTQDDILYATVLWKYFFLYRAFRVSITTVPQVMRCLWISMASAAVVAVMGVLQVTELFGVAEFLHTYYDQPFEGPTGVIVERGTSTIASSFGLADLMIMNFILAIALLQDRQGPWWVLVSAAAAFLLGCVAAGAFSGIIGLAVAILTFGVIYGNLHRLLIIGIPAAMVAFAALWPVIEQRLAGFRSPSGVPHSWKGRWENLENFFFPELLSNLNWVLGVRPAPRLPASETWREFVYIESGYVWLLWIGGLPLCAAFLFFVYVAASRLLRIIQEQNNAVRCAAAASFTYLMVIVTLMLLDPHLTVRGSADFFYPLLALAFVRERDATSTEASKFRTTPGAVPHLTPIDPRNERYRASNPQW